MTGPVVSRRTFVVGIGAVAATALLGCSTSSPNAADAWLAAEERRAIAVVGRVALERGIITDGSAALADLPAIGARHDGKSLASLEVTDAATFLDEFVRSVESQLQQKRFTTVAGYLMTPSEVALAGAIALQQ